MPADAPLALRVGFNAALVSFTNDYRAAGIHRYIVALLTALAGHEELAVTAFSADPAARVVLPPPLRVRSAPPWSRHPLGRIAWEQMALPWLLRPSQFDLMHGPAYAMPRFCRVPAVVTVHDLAPFRLPETLPRLQGAYLRAATRQAVRHAAALVTVSAFTARELVSLLGADPARVSIVQNGRDPACRPLPAEDVAAYRARAGLPPRFILTVGTLQPRKNLGRLLEAYAELRRRDPSAPPLVIAGSNGWGRESLPARTAALGIAGHVRLLGFVDAADLPLLYNAATVFAYPSRYEGFGLPVLEAMACGTPTVVASGSSLTEVAPHAPSVGPDDVAGWADILQALLSDPSKRALLVNQGLQRAAEFTWKRAADETAAVYREAAQAGVRRPALRPLPGARPVPGGQDGTDAWQVEA